MSRRWGLEACLVLQSVHVPSEKETGPGVRGVEKNGASRGAPEQLLSDSEFRGPGAAVGQGWVANAAALRAMARAAFWDELTPEEASFVRKSRLVEVLFRVGIVLMMPW